MKKLAFILMVLFPLLSQGQTPLSKDYRLSETATSVKVNALMQDSSGYIWVGTDSGLMCYNGQSFIKIADSIHKAVTAITIFDKDIWLGYSNGAIGRVNNSRVTVRPLMNGAVSPITSLHAYGNIALIATTEEQGIIAIVQNVTLSINTSNGLSDNFTYALSVISPDRILAATDMGINDITFANGKTVVNAYTTRQGLTDNIVTVIKKIPGSDSYYSGTQEGGIVVYNATDHRITSVLPPGIGWRYGQVNDIIMVSANRGWAATDAGYLLELILSKENKTTIKANYYPGKNFKKLLLDKAGNIWCATSQGITMITAEYIEAVNLNAPYSLGNVTAMICGDTVLWMALKEQFYSIYFKNTKPQLLHAFTAPSTITSLYKDKDGRIWIGTLGNGLYYKEPGAGYASAAKITGIADLDENASILNIAGTNAALWVAGLKGVEELSYPSNGKVSLVRHHGKKTGVGSDYIYQLYPDSKGNMWMATDGAGVCMYDGSQYHHWSSDFAGNSKVAYTITEDGRGDIWAGTMYQDVYHYHNGKWQNLARQESQYPDMNISTIIANGTGQVISVYQKNIDEWYPQNQYFRRYNSALGIGIDSTSNVLNCAARDKNGNVFIPYENGILLFKNQSIQYDIKPCVRITQTLVDQKAVLDKKNKFAYDENYIGFVFDGISSVDHERLNYRYLLEGYNDNWINTNDVSVSFPKLPPGNYKFRVQAALDGAFDNAQEDDYSFTILAPFWKTYWFYISVLLIAFIGGYLFIKNREKRLKKISQLQQERMMFEYEHLKSQVNPHFLFNSLYALSILIEEKKENAMAYTVHLADLYRNMLSYGRKELISLKEEFEILTNYIHIQQTRFGDALQLKIDIPGDIMAAKKIVPLALQLLVENAIKHNIVSVARPLVIHIRATNDNITVSNVILPKISKEKGEGIGLINIKKRYELLTSKPIAYGIKTNDKNENEYIVVLPLL